MSAHRVSDVLGYGPVCVREGVGYRLRRGFQVHDDSCLAFLRVPVYQRRMDTALRNMNNLSSSAPSVQRPIQLLQCLSATLLLLCSAPTKLHPKPTPWCLSLEHCPAPPLTTRQTTQDPVSVSEAPAPVSPTLAALRLQFHLPGS